jgi:hypothetical protein
MKGHMTRRILTILLVFATCRGASADGVQALKVTALRGEGAFNDVKRRKAEDVVVVVKNQDGRAVAGAKVVFTLPYSGPSGAFENNERTYTATSGADGKAAAGTIRPNTVEGRFNIRVVASLGGKEAVLVVSQTNTLASSRPGESSHGKLYIVLALIGGGGTAAALAMRKGSSSTAATAVTPTSLSTGTISVGGPR